MLVNIVMHLDYSTSEEEYYVYFWNEEDNFLCANSRSLMGREEIKFRNLDENPYTLNSEEVCQYEYFAYETNSDEHSQIIGVEIPIDEALNFARTYCVLHDIPVTPHKGQAYLE